MELAGALVEVVTWASTDPPVEVAVADTGGGGWTPSAWIALVALVFSGLALLNSLRVSGFQKSSSQAAETSSMISRAAHDSNEQYRREERERAEASQANKVWAWSRYDIRADEGHEDAVKLVHVVELMNASGEPVFDFVYRHPERTTPQDEGILLPTPHPIEIWSEEVPLEPYLSEKNSLLRVQFTNTSGAWVREPYERARRVSD